MLTFSFAGTYDHVQSCFVLTLRNYKMLVSLPYDHFTALLLDVGSGQMLIWRSPLSKLRILIFIIQHLQKQFGTSTVIIPGNNRDNPSGL